ncbi:MAG: family lipase [Bryobacterales bacterium]|nr:family lipase [Bryobacterales bacterium]
MKLVTALLLFTVIGKPFASAADSGHWVVTWGASPAPQEPDAEARRKAKLEFNGQTIREIVHASIGSDTVRVRLSNAYGKDTVDIGSAHIALSGETSSILPGTDRALTFSGRSSVSIPPNALVLSDPVKVNLPASGNLSISLFVPKSAMGAGIHYSAQQTSYIASGDQTAAPVLNSPETISSWVFVTGIDVTTNPAASTLVAFGDSITDGARSETGANHRWPNFLSDRLLKKPAEIGILDAGIGGNRILHDAVTNVGFGVNALARFDRDALSQPGVKYIIVLEGLNDLGHAGTSAPLSETVSAQDLIAGLTQLVERAHEKGVKIYGGTLTPFEGTTYTGYFTPEKEAKRKAINQWIRTSNAFDAVIDFEKAVADPASPDRMLPAYDSGDHLHPNDAGYKAMADAIDLSLFN